MSNGTPSKAAVERVAKDLSKSTGMSFEKAKARVAQAVEKGNRKRANGNR